MASTTYASANIASGIGLNTSPEIAVSGGSAVQDAIDSIYADVFLSTTAYAVTYSVTVKVLYSGGYASKTQNVKLDSSNYTGATVGFAIPGMTAAQCNTITGILLYCSDARIFVKSVQYVTINYTVVTSCGAPTLAVNDANPAVGNTGTLSGSDAVAGTNNAIAGYKIYRSTDDGESFGYLQTVTTTSPSFSVSGIAIPANVGDSYQFKAITVGAHSGYDSGYSNIVEITTTSVYCSAPTILTLSAKTTARKPTLSWANAIPGAGNAIEAYEIQYAESADGVTWGAWTALKSVALTTTSGSTLVDISAILRYYRKYRIKTHGALGSAYDSDWSTESDTVRTASSTASEAQAPRLIVFEYPHPVNYIPDYNGDYPVEYGPYPLGIVGYYSTLIIKPIYYGVNELSLVLPFSEAAYDLLKCGNLIAIAGKDEPYRIVTVVIDEDDTGVEILQVTAKSLVSLLGLRVVTYSALTESKPVTQIKALLHNQPILLDHYNAGIDDWIPDSNGDLLPDAYGDRRFPDLHWKEPAFDTEASAAISFQPEMLANVLDTFLSLCKIEGCGARVTGAYYTEVSDTWSLWLELYKGTDRSRSQDVNPHVIFDERLGNILRQTYTHSIEGLKTAGYATNGYLDELLAGDKLLIDAMSGNDYYVNAPADVHGGSGMNRAEIGMTVSDVTVPTTGTTQEKAQAMYAACKQIVRNEIAKAAAEHTYTVTLNPKAGQQYGIDFGLGDIVTVMNVRWGVSMDARIAEATLTYEPGKDAQVSLTLGEPVVSLLGKVKQIARRRG